MSAAMTPQQTARRGERGSATIWFAILAAAILPLSGLLTDGATMLRSAHVATVTAAEAARAASQELTPDAIAGHPHDIDPSAGARAARSYLTQAGVAGTVTIHGNQVDVTTRVPWAPRIYTFVPGRTLTGHAVAEAQRPLIHAP